MSDKLTTEQLLYIQTICRTDDVAPRHVRMMAAEILEFRSGKQWLDMVTKPIEPNPHASLIAQCEQDKVDYPEFWWELMQWKHCESDWVNINHHQFSWYYTGCEYRSNPHRDNIISWHGCSEVDKKRWQWRDSGIMGWQDNGDGEPLWKDLSEYRLRPRVCRVTLQDGKVLEYPEPVREELANGKKYFLIETAGDYKWQINLYLWGGDDRLNPPLYCNFIHQTEQAAEQHLAVLQAINNQRAI